MRPTSRILKTAILFSSLAIAGVQISYRAGWLAPAQASHTSTARLSTEIDVAGSDIKLDGNAITGAVGTSRFETCQDLANGNIALLYAAGGSITGAD